MRSGGGVLHRSVARSLDHLIDLSYGRSNVRSFGRSRIRSLNRWLPDRSGGRLIVRSLHRYAV